MSSTPLEAVAGAHLLVSPETAESPSHPGLEPAPPRLVECPDGSRHDILPITSHPHALLTGSTNLPPAEFLIRLVDSGLLAHGDLKDFLDKHPQLRAGDTATMVKTLTAHGLLTPYQVTRLLAGQTFGLILGNYRIMERIGSGGMGEVYKAEHIHMKRTVAIKVLVTEEDNNSVFLQRFYSEMQATAVLSHPNIVLAFDAGEMAVPNSDQEVLRYLVMEFVPGKDLEQHVLDHGPLTVAQACEYIRQAASGLQHAHEHGLVHRDMKPSNLLLTPQNQIKILDFGLARVCRRRHTEAHMMLGSVDYMAPEQARDARSVDIRADIYGLGGILYWLLAGQKPFPSDRPVIEELLARQRESPMPLHKLRPEVALELEAIVYQMMAVDPGDRYPTPQAVTTALGAFLDPSGGHSAARTSGLIGVLNLTCLPGRTFKLGEAPQRKQAGRVLIVSDAPGQRAAYGAAFAAQKLECREARRVDEALDQLKHFPADLLLVDALLPDGAGMRFCSQVRVQPPTAHVKVMLLTPGNNAQWLAAGADCCADECLPRTVLPQELLGRARVLLRCKESEDRADHVAGHYLALQQQLEQTQRLRDADQAQAQDVLIFALAKMAEQRGLETRQHLLRMQHYVRALAEEAMHLPPFSGRLDGSLVRMLERCVLLHDIGKVAIPDHILLKEGKLEPEERSVMESHTTIGADILVAVARQHGASSAFLQMATDIARYHHERYDGTGYPDGLAGDAIPLPARIVAVADVYDALRSKLVYKP
ncbi:MAG TPA: protein kinase, partial [Gemmataceae bacterium]|nr:protein kinase [Gemmataceae bacterium]